MKKSLSLLIALVMVISTGTMAFAQTTDYENSWAKDEINYMREKGILQGDQDGNFKPNNQIRKSEFYRVINGLIGYQEKAENMFSDVNSSDWFFEEVQKGLEAKYLSGGEILNATDNITREEVARIIAFVFDVEEDKKAAEFFEDSHLIKDELKGIIGGLRANGFINGFPDKTFRPTIEIKRADVVKMLYDISGEVINKAGTHSMDTKNNVVVNTDNVILKDMTIGGNLYLTEGIGEGDVTLDNVTVKGEVIVKGGGANSVIIKNSIINKISVDKQQGLVRVVFENSVVQAVRTAREVKVELTKGSKIQEVKLDGKIEVVAEKGTSIDRLEVTSKEVSVTSEGTIESIKTTHEIKVNNKEVKPNTEVKVDEGKAPQAKKETPSAKPADTSSGSTGGGDGYRDPIIDESTPTPRPPTPGLTVSEKEMNRVISLLKDGMLDDIIYPGDKKDGDKTLYSLASFVSEEVRKNINLNDIGISVTDFNGKYDENDKPILGTNDIKYGYYEITLHGAGKTVSKQIRIDTISVDTEKTFKDALRYNINKIKLKANIDLTGEIDISRLPYIVSNEYSLTINGEELESAVVDKDRLIQQIEMAQGKIDNAKIGVALGEYTQEAVDILKAAIKVAQKVLNDNEVTQRQIDESANTVGNAAWEFWGSQVRPEDSYTITRRLQGGRGKTDITNIEPADFYKAGTEITVKATPGEGYKFIEWLKDGSMETTNAEYTFTMPGRDIELIARFESIDAVAPQITKDLEDITTSTGTAITLDASSTVTDGGTVTYKWFKAEDAQKANAKEITGATEAIYAPAVDVAGTFYYYAVVTNTNESAAGRKTVEIITAVSTVVVGPKN